MESKHEIAAERRTAAPAGVARMRRALRILGWSAHTGRPRFGPKAQLARWALGQDTFPDDQRVRDGV
jgi:hypothetical protein